MENKIEIVKCVECRYSKHCDIQKILLMYDDLEDAYCSQGEQK